MPEFKYKAMDAAGKAVEGRTVASDLPSLAEALRVQGLFLMEGRRTEGSAPAAPVDSPPSAAAPVLGAKDAVVRLEDVSVFTTELAIMIRSALPILESLQGLARQQKDPLFRSIIEEMARGVRAGEPLSAACRRYPKVFDEVYVSLLAAGEASGRMPAMLKRICDYLEFQRSLRSKVRSALLYPTIVVLTTVLVVGFLVLFILPTFVEVFDQLEVELPLATRILLSCAGHLRHYGWFYLAGFIGAWVYAVRWLTAPERTRTVHELQLRIPFAGTLVQTIVITRVLRTLGALVSAGVPILQSLELTRSSAGNAVFQELLDNVRRAASQGRGLSAALAESPYFPRKVADMVANAERTGTLPEVLELVADHYEAETETALRDLFAVLEPIFIAGLGLLVGGIAVSVLWPVLSLSGAIQ